MKKKIFILVSFLLILVSCNDQSDSSVETLDVWPGAMERKLSIEGFNILHTDFSFILSKNLSLVSMEKLNKYIASAQKIRFNNFSDWPKVDRQSFLINIYHAFILKKMIAINFKKLAYDQFEKEDNLRVFKKDYTFKNFRDKEIIAKYPSAKVVLSLSCFREGCPIFNNRVYHYKNIKKLMNSSFIDYLKTDIYLVFDFENKTLKLSSYIKEFRRFFPSKAQNWHKFLKDVYKSDSRQQILMKSPDFRVIF